MIKRKLHQSNSVENNSADDGGYDGNGDLADGGGVVDDNAMLVAVAETLNNRGVSRTAFAQAVAESPSSSVAWPRVVDMLGGLESQATKLLVSAILSQTPEALKEAMSALLATATPPSPPKKRRTLQCPSQAAPSASASPKRKCQWSAEESAVLQQLVAAATATASRASWKAIAAALGTGKTAAQCSQHWARVINPAIRKGAWGATEEALLLRLHAIHGKCWTAIAADVPRRTDTQCRYQCCRALASRLAPWSPSEDAALLDIVQGLGGAAACDRDDWVHAAQLLAHHRLHATIPRTSLECKQRAEALLVHHHQQQQHQEHL